MTPKSKHVSRSESSRRRQRVAWLLNRIWAGSQSAMARDVGISQSTVSRVVSNQLDLSPRFLRLLAKDPRVNAAWIHEGVGQPLQESTADDSTLPIFNRLLSAAELTSAAVPSAERQPVASELCLPARYFLRLNGSDAVVQPSAHGLLAGDRMLFQAFAASPRAEDLSPGAYCAVRLDDRSLVMGKLSSGNTAGRFELAWLDDGSATGQPAKRVRGMMFDGAGLAGQPSVRRVRRTSIVGIALQLVRDLK